jgi:ankyrin repeat protein
VAIFRWGNRRLGRLRAACSQADKNQHPAAWKDHKQVVWLLLENGADSKAQDKNGWAVLHSAACAGDDVVARQLLVCETDVMARDSNGQTALHKAAKWGKETVAKMLLGKGANVGPQDNWAMRALNLGALGDRGATPLHWAADGGSVEVVRILLPESGFNIEAKDSNGLTAIHRAVWRGENTTVRLLVSAMKRTRRERRCKSLVLYQGLVNNSRSFPSKAESYYSDLENPPNAWRATSVRHEQSLLRCRL